MLWTHDKHTPNTSDIRGPPDWDLFKNSVKQVQHVQTSVFCSDGGVDRDTNQTVAGIVVKLFTRSKREIKLSTGWRIGGINSKNPPLSSTHAEGVASLFTHTDFYMQLIFNKVARWNSG